MLCPNHKVSKFTASHNSNLSHDWNDIQFIIDRRPLRDFVARAPTSRSACGGALNDEISHAARAFSLLLAGGALAHAMKLTAGGRGSFTFEGLYRSELLTAFKCKSPARCAELHDVCGEDEIITFVAFCRTLSHKTSTGWFKRVILSILASYQRLCKTSFFNAIFSSWCIFYGLKMHYFSLILFINNPFRSIIRNPIRKLLQILKILYQSLLYPILPISLVLM